MLNIVLFEPEIPPNTGNIIRLCANAGASLHLIHPLGFQLNEKSVRRAGLDYHHLSIIKEYVNYDEFTNKHPNARIFACTTKGKTSHSQAQYQKNDYFLFGPESRGLPAPLLDQFNQNRKIRIPMKTGSRSLNLANSCAIILYEAWRQLEYYNH
jgi:tRNA (cytidine/uridine-2'-O-)-methyltransferase